MATLVVAALGASPPAHGATIDVRRGSCDKYNGCHSGLEFEAAAGEVNDVTVESTGVEIRVTDRGAAVAAGAGCRSDGPDAVVCTSRTTGADAGSFQWVQFDLGDGDDALAIDTATGVIADGGPGDDVLRGGPGYDRFFGGGGHDQAEGNGGGDFFNDGDAAAGVIDADEFDGGAGNDEVIYAGRKAPVVVDLPSGAPTGQAGERDTMQRVEGATGGERDDRLIASAAGGSLTGGGGDDHLSGGPGRDDIHGEAGADLVIAAEGNDEIDTGPGADRVNAGPGNDRITTRDDLPTAPTPGDRVDCDAGTDSVVGTQYADLIADDCERIRPGDLGVDYVRALTPLTSLGAPLVSWRQECDPGNVYRLSARTATGTPLGAAVLRCPPSAADPALRLHLSARGRRLLQAHGRVKARITAAERLPYSAQAAGWSTIIRAPRVR